MTDQRRDARAQAVAARVLAQEWLKGYEALSSESQIAFAPIIAMAAENVIRALLSSNEALQQPTS